MTAAFLAVLFLTASIPLTIPPAKIEKEQPEQMKTEEIEETEAEQPEKPLICPVCGGELKDTDVFCKLCGSPVK